MTTEVVDGESVRRPLRIAEPVRGAMCERMTADLLARVRDKPQPAVPWLYEFREPTIPLSAVMIQRRRPPREQAA